MFEVVSWRQQDAKRPREPFLQIQATIIRNSASSLPAPQSCQKRRNALSVRDHAAITVDMGLKREQKCACGETPMSASKASLLLNDSYWKSSHGSDRCRPRTADEWSRRPAGLRPQRCRPPHNSPSCLFPALKRQKRHKHN